MWLTVFFTILLCVCALLGDYVGQRIQPSYRLTRSLVDNSVHALIGGLTWIVVWSVVHRKGFNVNDAWQTFGCTVMASFIDLDHFVAARSFKLEDAVNLNERPLLHNTTLVVSVGTFLILLSMLYPVLHPWGWIWLAASLSHHTRDAVRRGYSFFPWGETSAIPRYIYVLLLAVLPQVIAMCVLKIKVTTKKLIVDDYIQTV